MLLNTAFIRSCYIAPIFTGIYAKYGISLDDIGIPKQLMQEPMMLIPFTEVSQWFEQIERLSGDADFMVKIQQHLTLSAPEIPGNWFLSAPDLAISFRRINHGVNCFQSGASYYAQQSGKILKWCYSNDFAKGKARSHDSLRVAFTLFNAIKHYVGDGNNLLKVRLSGPPIQQQETEQLFNCPVVWNAPQTELWLSIDDLLMSTDDYTYAPEPLTASIPLSQLENFLNIPQPTDTPKVLYEMVNYSRYYGLPNVDKVAALFGISRQQLQRRLQKLGFTFTYLSGYIQCNQAIKYMLEGMDIDEIALRLGYSNSHSFSRSFTRFRRQTPTQYLAKLNLQSKKPL
ncbi:AraC family transcriptional regulator [Shewanella pneumatophori]|uniref:AraC family transcriptional regulator n=1 Tax=Shewanella pneumatophori TaxID=314092 RepID=A0A9X1ZDJ6_9GAMM|nr:AraC family transcriptional regulator [Shewanella pneumatophori]MCL1138150.1 AraC family transcriptional regulator [Shewanella pneumatophori]